MKDHAVTLLYCYLLILDKLWDAVCVAVAARLRELRLLSWGF